MVGGGGEGGRRGSVLYIVNLRIKIINESFLFPTLPPVHLQCLSGGIN